MPPRQNGQSKHNEARAQWVLGTWTRHPTMGYGEMLRATRKHFECGKTAGEQAIKRCYELMKERTAELVSRFWDAYVSDSLEDAENARNRGDLRAANKIRTDLATKLGLGAPERIEHTHRDYGELEDDEIDALAKLDGGESNAEH